MKDYILYLDHTYKAKKDLRKTNLNNKEMFLVCIETSLKGPIYTIVDEISREFESKDISLKIDLSYQDDDIPFSEETAMHSRFSIDTINNLYNMYPLIKQMLNFNTFIEANSCYVGSMLFISEIDIEYGKTEIHIDEFVDTKDVYKTFKHVNMLTNTKKHAKFPSKCIVLKDDMWNYIDLSLLPLHFDYIFIPINGTETLYRLSYDEFMLFGNISDITIELRRYSEDSDDEVFDEDIIIFGNRYEFDVDNIYSLLEACLFIPQMILLEYNIWQSPFELSLGAKVYGKEYTLKISSKDVNNRPSASLFYLFKRLLEIEL